MNCPLCNNILKVSSHIQNKLYCYCDQNFIQFFGDYVENIIVVYLDRERSSLRYRYQHNKWEITLVSAGVYKVLTEGKGELHPKVALSQLKRYSNLLTFL